MASQRLKLGTFFGIGLYVHWTFLLLVLYVVYATWRSGAAWEMVGFSVAQLLTVFACVTLHEYGHALAARRYGVGTADITLLPIGGVARLMRIPRVPVQELVIAVAGPAVNVVIAVCLAALLIASGGGELLRAVVESLSVNVPPETRAAAGNLLSDVLDNPTLSGFVLSILLINVLLVLFNMIPAFPMDGGRVLRSVLAMAMPYLPATRWAQRIGLLCACLMAIFAIQSDPPRLVMVLIAGFIAYAGFAEARQVEVRAMVEGLRVGDVMTGMPPSVRPEMTLAHLLDWWKTQSSPSAVVVGIDDVWLGHLHLRDVVTALREAEGADRPLRGGTAARDSAPPVGIVPHAAEPYSPPSVSEETLLAWQRAAIELTDPQGEPLYADELLEGLLGSGRQRQRQFGVVDPTGRLIGWIDLDTLKDRAEIAQCLLTRPPAARPPSPSLDRIV